MTNFSFYVRQCGEIYRYFCSFNLRGEYCSCGGGEASPKRCYDRIAEFMTETLKGVKHAIQS